jgi:predicted phage baseplate assembly protein
MGDPVDVFECDAEAGTLRFGDGLTGRRPRDGEALYATYAYSEGIEGNVGARTLKGGPMLPSGVTATNPVPTWGGADPETTASGEKQIARFITHRDRLVSEADFRAIAWRTPGVAIRRIDVLAAAHPDVAPLEIGSAPGAVTVMAIPAADPAHPDAPRADRPFLTALCAYLEPRRLITTELVVRGPDYVGIWVSVGIEVAGNHGIAETVEGVTAQLKAFLSPLPTRGTELPLLPLLYGPDIDPALRGWPLGRAVNARTLLAEAARTPGVVSVEDVLLARGSRSASESVPLVGLELPEILGISVVAGTPLPLDLVRGKSVPATGAGAGASTSPTETVRHLPAPVLAESC